MITQSLLFSCLVWAQLCRLGEPGTLLLASQRWVKTLLLPPRKGRQVGRRGSADIRIFRVCAGAGSSEVLERVLYLPCRKRRWQQTRVHVPGPASTGCVLPLLLITDTHRLFQPVTFLRGSSQLRSSTSAFLAGTKFSRLASFSCPEEAYF